MYILIDEFQDINKIQYDTVRLLAAPENNLFIVGDDDQSIYGFRGSKPDIMLNFEKVYRNAVRVLLDINYRPLAFIGRHTMIIYVVHQPLIFGIFMIINAIKG